MNHGTPVAHFRNGLVDIYVPMRGLLTEADIAIGDEPGRWHTEAVAQALVDVAEAARAWSVDDSSDYHAKLVEIRRALKRLEDAAKAASSSAEGA